MKLAGRVPVEPLDEERLTNIERRVVAGAVDAAIRGDALRAPRRLLGRAAFVVAIAAAGVVGWALHAGRSAPVAEPPSVAVQTAAQRSVIDIGDARIESDPETAFAVTRPGGGVLIALSRGKVALAVDKRGERPPLVVRAGDTDVVVVGTRFTVDYGDGRGEVDVQVTEGAVRVVHRDEQVRIAAGQAWRTRGGLVATAAGPAGDGARPPGDTPAAVATGEPADRSTVDASRDRSAAADGGPSAATGDRSLIAAAGDHTAAASDPAVLHDRRAAVPDAPSPARPAATDGHPRAAAVDTPRPRATAPDGPARPRVAIAGTQGELRAQVRAQRIEPALDLGETDAVAAVARYYDITAHRSGDEASQAFYSIAVVQALKLGRGGEALDTLDAYVRRFPGGKEFRAALWLRVRLLCLGQLDDRCRAAAYTYLHAAPDAPAAHVAELLTQTR